MNLLELSEQEIIRRNSMEQLRQMGIEPYPAAEYVTNAFSKEIKENFKDDAEPRPVSIAGRIMSRRIMGKASFMELQDSEGRIQTFARKKIKICITLFSRNCSISATLSESKVSYSVHRWAKFPSMHKR